MSRTRLAGAVLWHRHAAGRVVQLKVVQDVSSSVSALSQGAGSAGRRAARGSAGARATGSRRAGRRHAAPAAPGRLPTPPLDASQQMAPARHPLPIPRCTQGAPPKPDPTVFLCSYLPRRPLPKRWHVLRLPPCLRWLPRCAGAPRQACLVPRPSSARLTPATRPGMRSSAAAWQSDWCQPCCGDWTGGSGSRALEPRYVAERRWRD